MRLGRGLIELYNGGRMWSSFPYTTPQLIKKDSASKESHNAIRHYQHSVAKAICRNSEKKTILHYNGF